MMAQYNFRVRSPRVLGALLLVLSFISPARAGEGDILADAQINPNAKNWWVNCKSLAVKDNCIELVEMLDDASGEWIPAREEKNEYWKPGVDLPIREGGEKLKCGLGNSSYTDYCYWFKGAAVDGTDQMMTPTITSVEEQPGFPRIKLSLQAQNGVVPKRSKIPSNDHRWVALKPGTTFRLTVIADKAAENAGIAFAWMKNPSLTVEKGSDGKRRIIASGTVQEVNQYYWADRTKTNPCSEEGGNKLVANSYNVEFSINVDPYNGKYAVLQGTPPGGIFITQNGGCDYGVTVDPKTRMIRVISTGTHYDIWGDVLIGWVEASIRGDTIRKVFDLEPKTMNEAIIEVIASDGSAKPATYLTRYLPAKDIVEIRAFGYEFSTNEIRIKFQPAVATPTPTPTPTPTSSSTPAPTASPSPQQNPSVDKSKTEASKKVLICKKGKLIKKVVGKNPKCPTGYKA